MGRFKYLVDSPAQIETFKEKYHIPQGVALRYCSTEQIITHMGDGEVVILMIAFIEGRMTLPMGRIDVSRLDFLVRDDLPLVVLPAWQNPLPFAIPLRRVPPEIAAAAREEVATSRSSLDAEIDNFRFEEVEGEVLERPVDLSSFEADLDRTSAARSPKLVVPRIDSSPETKEEDMDLKQRPSLKGLLANRNKGSTSKEVPKTQVPPSLPPPPP
ncbi:hypothetical protein SO802_031424 [Lithocarpus litseifolius]|uniref:Uncharacterized protein n=1 Tax=Lithocarpus litseifolius TaxID=425828 RepID=A0AAW2BLY2_9ROSI